MAFEPILTRNIHKPDSATIDVYLASGGYQGLRRVLRTYTRMEGVAGLEVRAVEQMALSDDALLLLVQLEPTARVPSNHALVRLIGSDLNGGV